MSSSMVSSLDGLDGLDDQFSGILSFMDSKPPVSLPTFPCNHCGRDLLVHEDLQYAVFLYGIFFLQGEDDGFVGTTCPACLNTAHVYLKKTQFDEIVNMCTVTDMLGMSTIDRFKYYSPYISSPYPNPFFSEFKIQHMSVQFYNEEELFNTKVQFMYENGLNSEKLYCSYISDKIKTYDPYCSILWLNKSQAENLIQLEIEKEQRLIPRYFWDNKLLSKIEIFCWEHKNKFITSIISLDKRVTHESHVIDNEKFMLPYEGNIYELTENDYYHASSDFVNKAVEDLMETQKQDLKKESDFHEILVHDDALLKLLEICDAPLRNMITKNNPFLEWGKDEPFNTASFAGDGKEVSHKQIYKKLNDFQDKQYSKDFLKKSADDFMIEYESYAKSNSWSYSRLLSLKQKYVLSYIDAIEKGIANEDDYAFYKIGTKFKIRFNKKELPEHKLDGLIYLHFLVCNEGKLFTHHDLNKLRPKRVVNVGKRKDVKLSVKDDSFNMGISSEETTEICMNELSRLNKQYNEINEKDYPEKKLLIKDKLNILELFIKKSHHKNGTTRKIRGEYVNIQNRIGKAIIDAISWMENQGCKEAATHFRNTIEPYANEIGYLLTDTKIKWHTY